LEDFIKIFFSFFLWSKEQRDGVCQPRRTSLWWSPTHGSTAVFPLFFFNYFSFCILISHVFFLVSNLPYHLFSSFCNPRCDKFTLPSFLLFLVSNLPYHLFSSFCNPRCDKFEQRLVLYPKLMGRYFYLSQFIFYIQWYIYSKHFTINFFFIVKPALLFSRWVIPKWLLLFMALERYFTTILLAYPSSLL